ncbi:MAG: single-stranded-DNA-specific exonuclease RecJ [Acidobacteriota bacterium]
MNKAQWLVAPLRPEAETLAAELQMPFPIARILTNRNVLSPSEAQTFLSGTLSDLHDPFLMAGMEAAVDRIQRAVRQKEKILIFGDYDVDGVLSVVILLKALRSLGGEVDYFIPQRLKEGYGIKEAHIRVAKEKNVRLVISVDCGIKATSFAARAGDEGMDVIITDHHRPGEILPKALALLNPVLRESSYPYRGLAGVGVVFKLLQALLARENRTSALPHYAKLVAIGTIADVAELRGENRILVRLGLRGLENVSNPGLRNLLDQCGLLDRKITEGDVGFRIAPRINAAGRMGDAEAAVRLFLCADEEESLQLALWLSQLNARRQNEEDRIYNQALERIKAGGLDGRYKLLALGCESWHRGIIGIVASKLKDFFYRPVLLFAYQDGKAHGSGRSISELSLIDCLDECRDLFLDYGGHTLAVGCVLPLERMRAFRERINQVVNRRLRDEDLRRKIRVDSRLEFSDIEAVFIDHLLRLAPFGVGNPRPIFLSERLEVAGPPQLIQGKHLKFLARQDGRVFEALGWDKGEWFSEIRQGDLLDLVYSLQLSSFRGEETFSLTVEDIRASGQ